MADQNVFSKQQTKLESLSKELGFDIEDEKFWQKGFDQIGRMIKEIE